MLVMLAFLCFLAHASRKAMGCPLLVSGFFYSLVILCNFAILISLGQGLLTRELVGRQERWTTGKGI